MVLSFFEFCSVSFCTSSVCSESLQKSRGRGQRGLRRAQAQGTGGLEDAQLGPGSSRVWLGRGHGPRLSQWASVPGLIRSLSPTLEPSMAPTDLAVKLRPQGLHPRSPC